MIIILTGSTGLLGRQLKANLEKAGHQLIAIGRISKPPSPELVAGAEGLIHLAGENIAAKRWSPERKKALRDSRIGTAALLKTSVIQAGLKLKFVISASGIGIYGDRGNELLNEKSKLGTDFLSELCRDWEAASDAIPASRHVKMRLGVVLAAEGGFLKEVAPLFKRFGASRLSSGEQWFSWVHIEDAIAAFLKAVESENMTGAFNLTSPEPVTNKELTRELAKALNVWSAPPVPRLALKLLYGELADALLSSQRGIPDRLVTEGFKFKYSELQAALRVISFS